MKINHAKLNRIMLAAGLAVIVAGCASTEKSAAGSSGPKYIYVPPPTGSHIGYLAVKNPDGSVAKKDSGVGVADPEAFKRLQEKGGVNLRSGN